MDNSSRLKRLVKRFCEELEEDIEHFLRRTCRLHAVDASKLASLRNVRRSYENFRLHVARANCEDVT